MCTVRRKWRFLAIIAMSSLFAVFGLLCHAQYFDIIGTRKSVSFPFRLIRNLVIIQMRINGRGPFNFILDTGVGLMLITDPDMVDSIALTSKRTIRIAGLGEGDSYQAYLTPALDIDIPGLRSYDVSATILKADRFNLSNFVGISIEGLIGYELFNNLAVKLNFTDTTITVFRRQHLRIPRKGMKIPMSIEGNKPYIQALVALPGGKVRQCKMIIDLGAGHPACLENMISKNGLPQKFMSANLGVGLAGPIFGFISRLDEIDIGKYRLRNVITSFPNDYDSLKQSFINISRDGNIGVGILKRFTVILDYPDNALYLKPNAYFEEPFEHDMSGIEYYGGGNDYKHIIISRVAPGSPADEVGLRKDDEIVSINFRPVAEMSMEDIDRVFRSKNDRNLLLEVFRNHRYGHVILTLKRQI